MAEDGDTYIYYSYTTYNNAIEHTTGAIKVTTVIVFKFTCEDSL